MIAALAAAAIWLNIATYLKAPVSTTHSIVWWIMWAWVAALWVSVVQWWTMWKIAASWIISPVIWWLIAAFFLYLIKVNVLFKDDRVKQAKIWVPFFVSIMSWAFSTYIIIKWLKHLIKVDFLFASLIWLLIGLVTYFLVRKSIFRKSSKMKNNRESINNLFTVPLIFAAALLSFAHWANDVANAIWPLSAIYDAAVNSSISTKVSIPLWVMLIWAGWIAVWLALFGPRIIKTVWNEITELDKIRAFTIALSASITVIIASQLWLPVSSTHIALGWIFGVWFLREYLHNKKESKKEIFVKRNQVWKIAWAWVITVPSVAFLSWLIFVILTALA
jgi:PiT family inorganic phosphate transporter